MKSGDFIAKFESVKEAGIVTKSQPNQIRDCANGKQKTSNGFQWKYKDDDVFSLKINKCEKRRVTK